MIDSWVVFFDEMQIPTLLTNSLINITHLQSLFFGEFLFSPHPPTHPSLPMTPTASPERSSSRCWGTSSLGRHNSLRYDCQLYVFPFIFGAMEMCLFYEGLKRDYVLLQFLLPLIIEKLDSDVQSAKLDSLQTLVRNLCWFSKMCLQEGCKCGWYTVDIPLSNTVSHFNWSGAAERPRIFEVGGGGAYNLWRWCRVLLEKLRLVSYLTTLDIFQTACVSQYEHKDLAEFLEGLWASLRREVCLR